MIEKARALGYRHLKLNSYYKMETAHALYEDAGFRRVTAPPGFPEADRPMVVFMELTLD